MSKYMNEEKINHLIEISKTCNSSVLSDLVRMFTTEAPKRILEIKGSVKTTDFVRLGKASLLLSTRSNYLGAEKLAEVSKKLQSSSAKGEIPDDIDIILHEIDYLFNDATECLKRKITA